jgi:hypothetical protein
VGGAPVGGRERNGHGLRRVGEVEEDEGDVASGGPAVADDARGSLEELVVVEGVQSAVGQRVVRILLVAGEERDQVTVDVL